MKIESATENEFVNNTFMTYSPSTTYWIGLNDLEDEGVFKWSDGSSFNNYNNWFMDNPDNFEGNEDCVTINTGLIGPYGRFADWNDVNCDYTFNFICKR